MVFGREDGGAEQHVPPREQHAEVATAQHARLARHLVPQADGVVQPMEAGRDQQPIAQPAEMQPHIGVLQALQQLRDGDQQHVLRRLHADHQCRDGKHRAMQQIVEEVIAVVGPQCHLLLAVVQRVQVPPPVEGVRQAVVRVVEQVEQHQVDQEADDGDGGHAGPPVLHVQVGPAPEAQLAVERVDQRLQREEQQQREQAEPVEQRVDDVRPHGAAILHRLHGAPALQRPQHQQHHGNLHQAHQQPFGAGIGILHVAAHADGIGERHHDMLEQQVLRLGEGVGDPVEHVSGPAGGRRTTPGTADGRAAWRSRSPCAPGR